MRQMTLQAFSFTIPGSYENGVWKPVSTGYGSMVASGMRFVLVGFSEQSTLEYTKKYDLPADTRVARIEHNFKTVGMVHFFISKEMKEARQMFFLEQRQLMEELGDDESSRVIEKMEIGRAEIIVKGHESIKGKLFLRCSRNGNPTYSFSRDRFVPKLIGQVDMF